MLSQHQLYLKWCCSRYLNNGFEKIDVTLFLPLINTNFTQLTHPIPKKQSSKALRAWNTSFVSYPIDPFSNATPTMPIFACTPPFHFQHSRLPANLVTFSPSQSHSITFDFTKPNIFNTTNPNPWTSSSPKKPSLSSPTPPPCPLPSAVTIASPTTN